MLPICGASRFLPGTESNVKSRTIIIPASKVRVFTENVQTAFSLVTQAWLVSRPCNLGCDGCGGVVLVLCLLQLVKKLIELSKCVGNPEEITLLDYL